MRAPDFWTRDDPSARAVVAALTPLGWVYGAVTEWRRTHALPHRAHAKVICVGNLTAGGSGKTPVVLAIARMFQARGKRTAILSRGYGGRLSGPVIVDPAIHDARDVGDEPLLLARSAPVIVSRDRRLGADLADDERAEIIVMDDGHQNFMLEKDLSIVVVDAERGFGNGRILPAGPLRESVANGLARADAVVLVGDGAPALPAYSGPVIHARLEPVGGEAFSGQNVVAFAGIGRPTKFFDTLRALNANVLVETAFGDHHVFSASDIARLRSRARSENAMLVTTEKDFVRLTPSEREGISALRVDAKFETPNLLDNLLDKLMPSGARTAA
jgi:tetraacyldisaccharide 4'-kinase